MNDTKQTEKTDEIDQTKQFFREGFASYLDVIRALYLFQTEVANRIKEVLESEGERIKAAMNLEEEMNPISQSIHPKFPDDKWLYDSCDIYSQVWIQKPKYCNLYLGIGFPSDSESFHANLYCAVEVTAQYRRDEWLKFFRNCDGFFKEQWNNYAVGLRRPLKSPDDIKQELMALLDDFLKCIENKQN